MLQVYNGNDIFIKCIFPHRAHYFVRVGFVSLIYESGDFACDILVLTSVRPSR